MQFVAGDVGPLVMSPSETSISNCASVCCIGARWHQFLLRSVGLTVKSGAGENPAAATGNAMMGVAPTVIGFGFPGRPGLGEAADPSCRRCERPVRFFTIVFSASTFSAPPLLFGCGRFFPQLPVFLPRISPVVAAPASRGGAGSSALGGCAASGSWDDSGRVVCARGRVLFGPVARSNRGRSAPHRLHIRAEAGTGDFLLKFFACLSSSRAPRRARFRRRIRIRLRRVSC